MIELKSLQYRQMNAEEISRIGEVNREEEVKAMYEVKADQSGFGLVVSCQELSPPDLTPPWTEQGITGRANSWKPVVENGGFFYGVFDNDNLVGFVILGPKRRDNSGEIVAMFVDKDYRRLGIAGKLMNQAEQRAIEVGMDKLFLYSNPTESSVGFYLHAGFKIVGLISKEIVKSLPGDVVMAKTLG